MPAASDDDALSVTFGALADPTRRTMLARLTEREARGITGRQVATVARDGDPLGLRAMAELAHWLGEGLALIADVYDPELVVIGGGLSGSAPLFLKTEMGAGHMGPSGRYDAWKDEAFVLAFVLDTLGVAS